jgi:hypothetical protein
MGLGTGLGGVITVSSCLIGDGVRGITGITPAGQECLGEGGLHLIPIQLLPPGVDGVQISIHSEVTAGRLPVRDKW